MNKLGARRLLKLADILDKADALHKRKGEPAYNQGRYSHWCGTPACAWGHWRAANPCRIDRDTGAFMAEGARPEFGIRFEEVEELFETTGCGNAKTAKAAAAYIRAFVKRKQAEAT